jgi:hypothetical protein
MDAGDLSREQLDQLLEQVSRSFRFMQSLQSRIEQCRFPYDDEIRQRVARARDALHSLWVSVHYMACD